MHAIDSGADIVVGHGPHYSLPVEVYRGKPIFYGLGSFSFHTGHGGRRHGDWIGMMARIEAGPAGIKPGGVEGARFRFVRHNAANETVPCALAAEGATFDRLAERSARLDTKLIAGGRLGPDRAVTAGRSLRSLREVWPISLSLSSSRRRPGSTGQPHCGPECGSRPSPGRRIGTN